MFKILVSCDTVREYINIKHEFQLPYRTLKFIPKFEGMSYYTVRPEIVGRCNEVLFLCGDFTLFEFQYLTERNDVYVLRKHEGGKNEIFD